MRLPVGVARWFRSTTLNSKTPRRIGTVNPASIIASPRRAHWVFFRCRSFHSSVYFWSGMVYTRWVIAIVAGVATITNPAQIRPSPWPSCSVPRPAADSPHQHPQTHRHRPVSGVPPEQARPVRPVRSGAHHQQTLPILTIPKSRKSRFRRFPAASRPAVSNTLRNLLPVGAARITGAAPTAP